MKDIFHENLREVRLMRGLTQQEVADALGVAKSTYNMYESGKREPDVVKIRKLAKILNVTGDVLLGLEPIDPLETEFERLKVRYGERRLKTYFETIKNLTEGKS